MILIKKTFIFFITLFIILGIFQFVSVFFSIPSYLLPTSQAVLENLFDDRAVIAQHFQTTFHEWTIGLLISLFLSILLGIFCLKSRLVTKLLNPFFFVSQSVPYFIFIPFLFIWFGLGSAPKIFLVILTCIFPMTMVLQKEFQAAQEEYSSFISLFQLNFLQSLYHIYFPYSLRGFLKAFKISACYSFGSTVVAELMGSENGLGVYLQRAQSSYRLDKMMSIVLIILFMTYLLQVCIDFIDAKFIFWSEEKK